MQTRENGFHVSSLHALFPQREGDWKVGWQPVLTVGWLSHTLVWGVHTPEHVDFKEVGLPPGIPVGAQLAWCCG